MDSNAIKWSQNPNEKKILQEHLVKDFEHYFKGEYIRPQYLTGDLIHLVDFLKMLDKQELDILLTVKGNFSKIYITDKTFTEILLHCVEKTGPSAKRPLLFAIDYIISKHEPSSDMVIKQKNIIEKFANCENNQINGIARIIISRLNQGCRPVVQPQYFFKHNEQYAAYQQLRLIIERAESAIKFWDNYANHEILDYIHNYVDKTKLQKIKIIYKDEKYKTDLLLAKNKFQTQYQNIVLEIKQSTEAHDRFLIIDDEKWVFGPSLKDAAKGACVFTQLKDVPAQQLEDYFNSEWKKSTPI